MRRLVIVAAGLAVAVVLFLVLRHDDDDGSAQPGTSSTTMVTETTPTPPPALPPPQRVVRVQLVVKGGRPVGGVRNVTVAKGRRVMLFVTSDVAEEVHLHGYNLMRDVVPGETAQLTFRATIVGTVEVELEQSGVPLARITTTL
jgi:hypothetical protein